MAGRPRKGEDEKKIGEFIYLEPPLLKWLKDKANEQGTTTSVVVGNLIKTAKEQQG